jgi:hypothetical protein
VKPIRGAKQRRTSTNFHGSRNITSERDGVTNIKIPLKKKRNFDPGVFLAKAGLGRTIIQLDTRERAFSQGDAAASVFYIQSGRIRVSVIAKTGKEATIALGQKRQGVSWIFWRSSFDTCNGNERRQSVHVTTT